MSQMFDFILHAQASFEIVNDSIQWNKNGFYSQKKKKKRRHSVIFPFDQQKTKIHKCTHTQRQYSLEFKSGRKTSESNQRK